MPGVGRVWKRMVKGVPYLSKYLISIRMQVIETLLRAKQAGTSVRAPNRDKQVMY